MLFLTTGCSFNPLDKVADAYENTANELADTKFKNAKDLALKQLDVLYNHALKDVGEEQRECY